MADKDATVLAKILLKQIERESSQCAFWMISVLAKISRDSPGMTVGELMVLVEEELPNAAAEYWQYVKTT